MKRLGLVLAALIAACGRGEPAQTDSMAVAEAVRDSTQMHVTERGIGPIHAGMTIAEARQALTQLSFRSGEDSTGCAYPTIAGLPEGVLMMVDKGKVARIDVTKGDVATTEGVRIGDDTTKLRQVYGSRVTPSPHKYTDGKYYTVVPEGDTLHRVIFETNVQGVVLRYRAGQMPQVAWVESCS